MKLLKTLRLTVAATAAFAVVGTPAAFAVIAPSVTAAPNPVKAGDAVTYTVAVAGAGSIGTVTVRDDNQAIAGCVDLPVSGEAATCTAPASATPGWHLVSAGYTRNASTNYGYSQLRVFAPTTTTVTAAPALADPGQTMSYVATVSRPEVPVELTSLEDPEVHACSPGCGGTTETAAFSVDGVAVETCAARPVDYVTGVATCSAVGPTAGGAHEVTASYSGATGYSRWPSTGRGDFAVKAPAAALSAGALDFGSVTVGANSARSVSLTNSGTGDLHPGATAVSGPYTITSNGCTDVTLTPGASCAIALAFSPSAAGASAAALTIDTDAGAQTVALAGTGVAATVITTPPTGAKFAPNESTTLSVSKSDAGTSSVTVPVRCPTGVACTLDGTVIIATSDLAKAAAHSSATNVQTVARFSGVRVAAGKVKEIKLKLSPAFIKSAQRRGIRLIRATLTINTTFTDGTKATSKQRVKIRIPKAVVKQAAKQGVSPRFTG